VREVPMTNNKDIILKELSVVKEAICGVKEDVSQLKQNQERNEKMITQLLQIVGSTNAKVGSFDEKMITLKESSSDLNTNMEIILEKIKKQDEMIEILTKRSLQQEKEILDLKKMKSA
jgi:chromosome segregation ATPase